MAEDMGDKTEQPTGRRLGDAREKGQIAKSADLTAGVDLAGAILVIALLGSFMTKYLMVAMRECFATLADVSLPHGNLDHCWPLIKSVATLGFIASVPILGLMTLIGVLGSVAQTGPLLTLEPLRPNLGKLNPIAGTARLFKLRNLIKTLTSILKLMIIGAIAWKMIMEASDKLVALPRLDLWSALAVLLEMMKHLAIWLVSILLLIGAADFFYQRWQHLQDLRMTKQEVEDERKGMESDPEMKRRQLKFARQIALQRVSQAVPKANVVVTNPTHFAVALHYEPDKMRAPRVIAKGADEMALRIRMLANTHGVPIVERPPLARGLYWGVDVGQEIDPEFYQACAEVLAYVYRLEKTAAAATAA